jgi:hypothetical protein
MSGFVATLGHRHFRLFIGVKHQRQRASHRTTHLYVQHVRARVLPSQPRDTERHRLRARPRWPLQVCAGQNLRISTTGSSWRGT